MTGIYISTIVFASILGITMYFVNCKLAKNRFISFVLTISSLYVMKNYICARAQLITFILFILTVYFIEMFLETKKKRYAAGLIIIPILIANLHIATFCFYFILYLPYIAEVTMYILAYCNVIISESVINGIRKKISKNGETEELTEKLKKAEFKYQKLKEKEDSKIENPYKVQIRYNKNIKLLIVIFIICIFTGLLTPLGKAPYTYLIKTMQGISTKNINEHLPVVLANNIILLIVFGIYIAILLLTKVKVRASDLFMLAGLSILTIYSQRQASMLFLIGSIILNRLITDCLNRRDEKTIKWIEKYTSTMVGIIIITVEVIILSFCNYKSKIDDNYVSEEEYPVQASEWIKENLDVNEIKLYNDYNFGSYLIYENIPVFIDSRCDLYLPEFNEGVYVFKDYLSISGINNKYIEEKMENYGFTHFIIKKTSKLDHYFSLCQDKYKKIYPEEEMDDKYFTIYERID